MAPTQQQSKAAKAKVLSGGKTPKARISRYLKGTESQLVEGGKSALMLKGIRCSDAMSTVLKDLRAVRQPDAKLLGKNNVISPFEDEGQRSLEFLTTKNDCSLFALASHNKKRPNNLVLGRTFERRILDIVELGILRYKSLTDFKGAPKKRIGSKPMMMFVGDRWHLDQEYKALQNLLLDFYRGDPVKKIILSGLDHIMVFTISDPVSAPGSGIQATPVVNQRVYYCKLKKDPSGGKAPVPYLTSSGPDMDFKVRRTQYAAPDIWKLAMIAPKATKKKKVKNLSTNIFGETVGRIHLEKQDVDHRTGKKAKALRVAEKMEKQENRKAIEEELQREGQEQGDEFRREYGFEEAETEKESRKKGKQ